MRELALSLGFVPKSEVTVNSMLLQHPPAPKDLVLLAPPDNN